MRRFTELYEALDASTATTAKVAAMVDYFGRAPPEDAAWAVYFLAGGKPRQVVPTALLRRTACAVAGIDDWLFDECYQAVGDLAETIAHVLPAPASRSGDGLAYWVEQRLMPLKGLSPEEQAHSLRQAFGGLDTQERFLFVKLIGGGFRVGVSKLLVQRALAEWAGLDPKTVAQRMMGYTDARHMPSAQRFQTLVAQDGAMTLDAGHPYPFFLAHALPQAPAHDALGPVTDWLVEWKYDGIRAQVVRRAGQAWIWSRGEELVTERFPEIVAQTGALPEGTVLDGEVLAWLPGQERPAPFALLQQRIARKLLTKKVLAQAPLRFVAYDLLEHEGHDLRGLPQQARRDRLQALLGSMDLAADASLALSPEVVVEDWVGCAALRETARERGVEGFMLKHRTARYGSGRTKADGTWWKWKVDPLSVDAVLIYAQAGHGRRAGVYTDYTFAVWSRPPVDAAEAAAVVEAIRRREPARPDGLQLVAFAKAYSGLSDAEFARVDKVIRATTLEKFGPVRSVAPSLVFELGFEGLNVSPRHKSGIAVRFPRMLRIRDDKPLHEADTLQTLHGLLAGQDLRPASSGLAHEASPRATAV
ncbi:MAG: ATP-dependent DNA ligase [Betaproteobacteria bacterium]